MINLINSVSNLLKWLSILIISIKLLIVGFVNYSYKDKNRSFKLIMKNHNKEKRNRNRK